MKTKISKAVKRDRIFINLLPIVFSGIIFLIIKSKINAGNLMSPAEGFSLFETMVGIWGTLLGFMITAVSILLAFNDGNIIKKLKETGHYNTVLICYASCCLHLLVALSYACICLFGQIWGIWPFLILCAISIDILAIVLFCLYFLFAIILNLD